METHTLQVLPPAADLFFRTYVTHQGPVPPPVTPAAQGLCIYYELGVGGGPVLGPTLECPLPL